MRTDRHQRSETRKNSTLTTSVILCLTFSITAWVISPSLFAEEKTACQRFEELKSYYKAHRDEVDNKLLATAMNNCGIEYSNKSQWNTAEKYLTKARKLDPGNQIVDKSLAGILASRAKEAFDENRFRKAKNDYTKALRYDPDNGQYKLALSEVLYRMEGKTGNAKRMLTEGAEDLSTDVLDGRIEQFENEMDLESKTRQVKRGNWIVRMDPDIGEISTDQVFDTIDEVSKEVGNDFRYWIKHRVIFVLVTQEDFQNIHSGEEWSGAINDGRIKIPVTGNYKHPQMFKGVMAHEFTHSVVNAFAKGKAMPFLLHEGLAEYEEHKVAGIEPNFSILSAAAKTNQLIPLATLARPDTARYLKGDAVHLAYQQSHSFVLYLEARRRFGSLVEVLKYMGQGMSFEEAIVEGIGRNMDYLEEQWLRWLRQENLL